MVLLPLLALEHKTGGPDRVRASASPTVHAAMNVGCHEVLELGSRTNQLVPLRQ